MEHDCSSVSSTRFSILLLGLPGLRQDQTMKFARRIRSVIHSELLPRNQNSNNGRILCPARASRVALKKKHWCIDSEKNCRVSLTEFGITQFSPDNVPLNFYLLRFLDSYQLKKTKK